MSDPRTASETSVTRILDIAIRCCVERGLDEVTIANVAREASVSRATVHRHFPDRDALVREAIRGRILRFADGAPALPDDARASARLRRYVGDFAAAARAHNLAALRTLTTRAAGRFPDLQRLYEVEVTGRVARDLSVMLAEGMGIGELTTGDHRAAAIAIAELLTIAIPAAASDLADGCDAVIETALRRLLPLDATTTHTGTEP